MAVNSARIHFVGALVIVGALEIQDEWIEPFSTIEIIKEHGLSWDPGLEGDREFRRGSNVIDRLRHAVMSGFVFGEQSDDPDSIEALVTQTGENLPLVISRYQPIPLSPIEISYALDHVRRPDAMVAYNLLTCPLGESIEYAHRIYRGDWHDFKDPVSGAQVHVLATGQCEEFIRSEADISESGVYWDGDTLNVYEMPETIIVALAERVNWPVGLIIDHPALQDYVVDSIQRIRKNCVNITIRRDPAKPTFLSQWRARHSLPTLAAA